jgi:hypothetical protein
MGKDAMATARFKEFCRSAANVLEPVTVVSGLVTEEVVLMMLLNTKKLGRSWLRSAQR